MWLIKYPNDPGAHITCPPFKIYVVDNAVYLTCHFSLTMREEIQCTQTLPSPKHSDRCSAALLARLPSASSASIVLT